MQTLKILTALMLVASLAAPTTAQERAHRRSARARTQAIEAAAPPWSAACMTDHGPSECGEPMWIYGSNGDHVTYRNAF
jgi:hypothetical protein